MKVAEKMFEHEDLKIRIAEPKDAPALLDIYRFYVLNTAITFEYTVPSVEVFAARIEKTLKKYPYLVLEKDNQIVGYVYASVFHEREAYDWAVETSIYIHERFRGKGYGRILYDALEKCLKMQNIQNLNACIAYTEHEDIYLTNGSQKFHEKIGYHWVGKFNQCGYKFGRWYDMIWLEKIIGQHEPNPKKVIPFSKLCEVNF